MATPSDDAGAAPYLDGPDGSDAGDGALEAFVDAYVAHPVDPAELLGHRVTAVMVTHQGSRWARRSLAALAESSHLPDQVIAVDTGSTDDTIDTLVDMLGSPAVVEASTGTGFGAAVARGIEAADAQAAGTEDVTEWIWLLHDDSAPDSDALIRLLECAIREPDAAVIGPKVRSWSAPRQLLEVGLTMTRGGRRHTGLERREYDQGQHDTMRDVLAVGSAGLLVRRSVWDELGGFDPEISFFRDDLDFGWRANAAGHRVVVCPDAVVYHLEAAAHGRRPLAETRLRPHLVDRRNALYVLLANAPATTVLFVALRLLVGGLGRSLGYLLGKQPALAAEELVATVAVLVRPDRIIAARRRRRPLRRVPAARLRRLFPPLGHTVRTALETVYGLVQGTGTASDVAASRRRAAGIEEDEDLQSGDPWIVRFFSRPAVLLVVAAILVALVASRDLIGGGRLAGGALLPAPLNPGMLWQTYTEAWHGVGLGSPTAAPPYLAVVAVLGTVLGSPSLAVDLLLLGSVPLAALTAALLLRRIVAARWVRVWAAGAYATLPILTGAISAGRLGTAVATVVAPLVLLAARRTLGLPASDGLPARPGPFRAAWSVGLLLALTASFVPLAWVLAVLVGLAAIVVYRTRAAVLRVLAALVVTPVVLAPWTFEIVRSPVTLLTEAGVPGPGLSTEDLPGYSLLLLAPGGPANAPLGLGLGVLLAAGLGLWLGVRRGPVITAWAVALLGLIAGVVISRVPVTGPTLESPVSGWPGFATVVVGGALILAAAFAADDRLPGGLIGQRLTGVWRPVFGVVAVLAILTPVLATGWWLARGADEPLDRRDPTVLPVYVAEQAAGPNRIRTLVLDRAEDERIAYALLREGGPMLGQAETGPAFGSDEPLAELVGDLASGLGTVSGADLATFGARYVYLPAPFDVGLADALDAVPGLVRASPPSGAAIWRVEQGAGRVRLLPVDSTELTATDQSVGAEPAWEVLPSGPVEVHTAIPAGEDGRVVALAELADDGWSATLDGEELTPVTVNGWAQGFEVPAAAGDLEVTHESSARAWWLWAQLVVVVVAIVLALPAMRRQAGALEDVAELDPDDSTTPGFLRPEELVGIGTPDTATARGGRRAAPYRGRRARGRKDTP